MIKIQGNLQIVILAAGLGRRMKSSLPKVLHKVCGQTLLERVVRAAAGLCPKRIIVVVGHGKEHLCNELDSLKDARELSGIDIMTVLQSEQLGTGHAMQIAFAQVDESISRILVLPGDSPLIKTSTLEPLVKTVSEEEGATLALLSASPSSVEGLGRIVRGADGRIERIVEELDCSAQEREIREVNSSIYAGNTLFFKEALAGLEASNAQEEFYLTDIVDYGVQRAEAVVAVQTPCAHEVAGANTRAELSVLERFRRIEINKGLMLEGVSFEDPLTTYIDEQVEVGVDCFIGAGTRLGRGCIVGSGVVIDGQCLLVDSEVGSNTHIKHASCIESSRIGQGCNIGPFAHLRPGSVLEGDVKIGNFVETKKVHIRKGAKVNHLTYIGDAELGEEVNVGAGTITCNYDGLNKHKTVIEKGAFIGSNVSLVAPVTVGSKAVIGAGSVISKDVPGDSLALERTQQKTVKDWSKKKNR